MKDMKLHDWLNLAGAIGVLAGLVLVTVELKQTNDMAAAEALRDSWYADINIDLFALENQILPLQTKSIVSPLDLTDEEIEILDAYLTAQMQHQISVAEMKDLYDLGFLAVEAQAADIVDDLLVGAFGRGWFSANEHWLSAFQPELVTAIKEELAKSSVNKTDTWPSEMREHVRRVVKKE